MNAVKEFFGRFIESKAEGAAPSGSHGVQVATAALLVEMMRADFQELPEEEHAVLSILQQDLQLTSDE